MRTITEAAAASGADASTVPRIPASRMNCAWLRDFDLLLWVRTGSAFVHTADGPVHHVSAGGGLWMPSGEWEMITTEAGTVAFPYLVPPSAAVEKPQAPLTFAVPAQWQDWLILHFVHGSTGHGIFGYRPEGLADLIGTGREGSLERPTALHPGEEPPLPRASAARRVAHELRENPAFDHGIDRWAKATASSVSTIRRGFLEIGWTFDRWRTATRLATACGLLASGFAVETAAMRVGFSSRHGFTRAFGKHYGLSPSDYSARMSVHSPGSQLRTEAATGTAVLAATIARLTETAVATSAPGPVPATRTAWHHNDVHVLAWLFKGTGDLSLGPDLRFRRQGDAMWIPAGVDHQAGNGEGAVTLPVCYLWPEEVHISEPLQVRFSDEWTDFLLHRAVATRTMLRPDDFNARDMLDLFTAQLTEYRARRVPMPVDVRARAVADSYLARMQLPPDTIIPTEVHRVFRAETGMSLASWQLHARMGVARELLDSGAHPTDVARRVGYLRARSFSRAFRNRYGLSPREYRDQRQ
ncbi:helix-turn-helix transcriptional regulator [Brevibacterium atlanticum]|uniref:helix-turn-helix transcriptional regulator n=1 Tax=Brevibacterium atlanticum TaxID=2697563 RepID=UPI001421AE69|nr:helix-turn-helix domain-containing protein [Brevibacterium atlanticum]